MTINILPLTNHAGVEAVRLESIRKALSGQYILESVIRWGEAQNPPRRIVDIITQDEFTHDVILPFEEGIFLVYDTT